MRVHDGEFSGVTRTVPTMKKTIVGRLKGQILFVISAKFACLSFSPATTFEFTGLRGFSRRSGAMMG